MLQYQILDFLITKCVATSYILPKIQPAHRSAIVLTCRDIGNNVPGVSLNIQLYIQILSAQIECHSSFHKIRYYYDDARYVVFTLLSWKIVVLAYLHRWQLCSKLCHLEETGGTEVIVLTEKVGKR
jgi:hypothetical protein